jgi:hypothetical protein
MITRSEDVVEWLTTWKKKPWDPGETAQAGVDNMASSA